MHRCMQVNHFIHFEIYHCKQCQMTQMNASTIFSHKKITYDIAMLDEMRPHSLQFDV